MTDMQDSEQNVTYLGREYDQTTVYTSPNTYWSNAKYAAIYEMKY